MGVEERAVWMTLIAGREDLPAWLTQQMRDIVIQNDLLLSQYLGNIELAYWRTIQTELRAATDQKSPASASWKSPQSTPAAQNDPP